ncbi:MAG: GntR family transcriptional regulator [Phycisphaerales bacterium]|nr:GntR family transcriptional regulator [Phycisphaerales bacterium]
MPTTAAYRRLKQSIYDGSLRAGQKLVERELSRRLGVSRIPLRESLIRLEAEGLVRSIPYSSTFVEDLEPVDVLEIYSLRLALEPMAARLATINGRPSLIGRLRRWSHKMAELSRQGKSLQTDRIDYAFHHAIVRASGHKRLLRAYESAHILIVGPRLQYAHLKNQHPEQIAEDHMKIVNLMEAGDAEGAERAAYEHVAQSMVSLEKIFDLQIESAARRRAGRKTTKGTIKQKDNP